MYVNRLRTLCIKIFKTLSNINPAFINEIFELRKINRAVRNQYKLILNYTIIAAGLQHAVLLKKMYTVAGIFQGF